MDARDDAAVWHQWYPIGTAEDIRRHNRNQTRLLGMTLELTMQESGIVVHCEGRALPVKEHIGYIWTTLGEPDTPAPPLPEYDETDRISMNVWSTPLKCSGLRIIDNVVDNGHFPFVHPGILGDQDHLELDSSSPLVDEHGTLWSRSQKAWLPITNSDAEYTYRIPSPYSVILYIHRPDTPDRHDILGVFAQPVSEESFIAHKLLVWIEEDWMEPKQLRSDQQWISVQDKYVLERHTVKKLPLNESETSASADTTSIAYRQWLRDNDVRYGAIR